MNRDVIEVGTMQREPFPMAGEHWMGAAGPPGEGWRHMVLEEPWAAPSFLVMCPLGMAVVFCLCFIWLALIGCANGPSSL